MTPAIKRLHKLSLRPGDRRRIQAIRRNIKRFQRKGVDVTNWEAVFFLKIIDKFGLK